MVQLLLNVGGKSSDPGQTGFDGSIRWAAPEGHDEIASLVQEFAGIPEPTTTTEDLHSTETFELAN